LNIQKEDKIMQVMLNIPDEIPQEMVNKLLRQFENQIQTVKNSILKPSQANNDVDKLTVLRSALIAGENSGVVENYSLANLLAELDAEELA
jgi:hypothetical protein